MLTKQYTGKKREVQYHFYNKVQSTSNIVALAGNNLDLHIKDFKHITTGNKKAYVYDLSEEVISKFKYLEENHSIVLIKDNVINCRIERFMDIDLMRTLDTTQGTLFYLFNEQYMKYSRTDYRKSDKVSAFMFTYCLRNNKTDIHDFINMLCMGKDLKELDIDIKTYRDGAPMCTTQIIWK